MPLTAHLKLLENDQNKDVLLNAHLYLVKISQVEEREVFKVCLSRQQDPIGAYIDHLYRSASNTGLASSLPCMKNSKLFH